MVCGMVEIEVMLMPLRYKIDVLTELKKQGYTTNKIRKEKILSESTLQKFRRAEPISWGNIEMLCRLLRMQPGDIITFEE